MSDSGALTTTNQSSTCLLGFFGLSEQNLASVSLHWFLHVTSLNDVLLLDSTGAAVCRRTFTYFFRTRWSCVLPDVCVAPKFHQAGLRRVLPATWLPDLMVIRHNACNSPGAPRHVSEVSLRSAPQRIRHRAQEQHNPVIFQNKTLYADSRHITSKHTKN